MFCKLQMWPPTGPLAPFSALIFNQLLGKKKLLAGTWEQVPFMSHIYGDYSIQFEAVRAQISSYTEPAFQDSSEGLKGKRSVM